MRAAVYARVSSPDQRDRHTIASQMTELPTLVAQQGWTLDPALVFVDDGKSASSGKLEQRTGLPSDAAPDHGVQLRVAIGGKR